MTQLIKISFPAVVLKGLLLCSQGPADRQYPETVEFNPQPLFKNLCHNILLSVIVLPKLSSLRFFVPSHPPGFNQFKSILWRVKIMNSLLCDLLYSSIIFSQLGACSK